MALKFNPLAISALIAGVVAATTGRANAASAAYPSTNPRALSERGVAFIKQEEGFRARAYKDGITPVGLQLYSIGYGHQITGKDGLTKDSVIDVAKGDQLFRADVQSRVRSIIKNVRVPLTQSQFDALVSLSYNIGLGAFERSTLLRRLNEGNYEAARLQFLEWDKNDTQNVGRRKREANLFATR